ncbi:terminase large subunit, partial [Yoonia sp.]|uniref:terminase large subunit n=1 Tax=Yoonia sp. TaxID=2212373 RepID=UPI00391C85B3
MTCSVDDAIEYARDVVSGKIKSSIYVRKQCAKFIHDLDYRQEQPSFRWTFNRDHAAHVLTYVQLLNFVEGAVAGTNVVLEPWQAFILSNLYGWIDKNDPEIRRYTSALILVGRKNGKSTLLGALALYELMFAPDASQIVTMATMREQAKLVWNMSGRMMQVSDPRLTKGFKKSAQALANPDKWSRYWPLSKESKSLDGLNIRMAIVDEAAAVSNQDLFDVVTSSMGNQKSPLTVMITTGQPGAQSNYFYTQLDYAKKVLDGTVEDDRIFTLAYQIDEGDNWKDSNNWIKANPNLGVSVKTDFLHEELKKAEEIPAARANFRTKYLNEFISTSQSWIEVDKWNKNAVTKLKTELPMYVGLDLGSTSDLTAVSQVWAENGEFFFDATCFIPEEAYKSAPKHVRNIYSNAVDSGKLIITEGEVADHAVIRKHIEQLNTDFDLREVAYDNWNASQITSLLQDSGLTMVKFPQAISSMSPAAKETELLIRNGTLKHSGDPFLAWQLSNAEIYIDNNENIKVRKGTDNALKIDAIIAMIMAIGRATSHGAIKAKV